MNVVQFEKWVNKGSAKSDSSDSPKLQDLPSWFHEIEAAMKKSNFCSHFKFAVTLPNISAVQKYFEQEVKDSEQEFPTKSQR